MHIVPILFVLHDGSYASYTILLLLLLLLMVMMVCVLTVLVWKNDRILLFEIGERLVGHRR